VIRLEALHAQPAPEALAVPDRPADPALWGAQDGIVTPSYGDGLRQEIPDARIDIIPAVGHFPHWEQPEEFVQRLSAFVDGRNA
jgi:pimeloyl-ACP methyl ester carboxylesterase